jgi:hypothetical protein
MESMPQGRTASSLTSSAQVILPLHPARACQLRKSWRGLVSDRPVRWGGVGYGPWACVQGSTPGDYEVSPVLRYGLRSELRLRAGEDGTLTGQNGVAGLAARLLGT